MIQLNFHIKLDEKGAEISSPSGFRLITSDGVVFDKDLMYALEQFMKTAGKLGLLKEIRTQ